MPFIITANFVDSGAVAYRRADGTWSLAIADAGVGEKPELEASAATAAKSEQHEISDPYVIDVVVEEGVIQPQSARERIRATGPTIRIRRPD